LIAVNDSPTIVNPENLSSTFRDHFAKTLDVDVEKRPDGTQLLQHPFFAKAEPLRTLVPLIKVTRQAAGEKWSWSIGGIGRAAAAVPISSLQSHLSFIPICIYSSHLIRSVPLFSSRRHSICLRPTSHVFILHLPPSCQSSCPSRVPTAEYIRCVPVHTSHQLDNHRKKANRTFITRFIDVSVPILAYYL